MRKLFLAVVIFILAPIRLFAENCEWWDAACHERNKSGVFALPGQVIDTIDDGAKTVGKVVEGTVQTGKDIFGGGLTVLQGDLFGKLAGLLRSVQSIKDELFSDKEDGTVAFFTDYAKRVSEKFGHIGKIVKELDDLPDTVTPADLGKKVVAISNDLSVLHKISKITGFFEKFLDVMEPVSIDLLSLGLLFSQNSGRYDLEKIYLERTRQAKIFFDQMSRVLEKTGVEWDELAPQVTAAFKGTGQLIQVMSGTIQFLLKMGNLTTKDLLERALKGDLLGQSATLRADVGEQVHSLIGSIKDRIELSSKMWQGFDEIIKKLSGLFEYGLDVLIPRANAAFFLVDDRLNDLSNQVAGLGKAHSIAQILSYLTPVLKELIEDTGLIQSILDLIRDVVSTTFKLKDSLTLSIGPLKVGPYFEGIDRAEIEKGLDSVEKIRKAVIPMLAQLDKQLPKIIDILEPLAKVHEQALNKK